MKSSQILTEKKELREYMRSFFQAVGTPTILFSIYFSYYFINLIRPLYEATKDIPVFDFIIRLGFIYYFLLIVPIILILVILAYYTWIKIYSSVSSHQQDSEHHEMDHVIENIRQLRWLGIIVALAIFGWWTWSDLLMRIFVGQAYGQDAIPIAAFENILISFGIANALITYISWEAYIIDGFIRKLNIFTLKQRVHIPLWLKFGLLMYVIPLILGNIIFGTFSSGLAAIRKSLAQGSQVSPEEIIHRIRTLHIQAAVFFVVTFVFYILILATLVPSITRSIKALQQNFAQLNTSSLEPASPVTSIEDGTEIQHGVAGERILRRIPLSSGDEYVHVFSDYNAFITRLHENVKSVLETQENLDQFFKTQLMPSFQEIIDVYQTISGNANQMTQLSDEQSTQMHQLSTTMENMKTEFDELTKSIVDFSHSFSEITQQIRIVSLNAAIEAARISNTETKSGFNVIASTIQELNEEAARLQKEIVKLVMQKLDLFHQIVQQLLTQTQALHALTQEETDKARHIQEIVTEHSPKMQHVHEQARRMEDYITEVTRRLQVYKELEDE